MAAPSMEAFDAYFRRADLDRDGRISGAEAVAFFQGSNLPKQVLAQIWMHADQHRIGFLGRQEFYNALKLVTVAQSGRELTPDIVKAALFGPAATKIPAPQINSVSSPAAQMNMVGTASDLNSTVRPSTQIGGGVPTTSQNFGFKGANVLPNAGMNQQFALSSDNQFMRPPQATPTTGIPTQGTSPGLPGRGSIAGPLPPSSNMANLSTDWLGGRTSGVASVEGSSQVPIRGITPSVNQDGFGLVSSGTASGVTPNLQTASAPASSVASKQLDSVLLSFQSVDKDSKALVVSGNGFPSDSTFGRDAFSATSQAKQDASAPSFSASNMPNLSTTVSVASGSQNSIKPGQLDPLGSLALPSSGGGQLQQTQSLVKQNQLGNVQSTSTLVASSILVGPHSSASSQSEPQWPKFTQSNIQKYTNVFVEVDKDRDGKITGEQARNLFLSWRLPREVLKQVWDLSDQDNDSMLTLREFCTALYLMERYREGHPLPAVLPNSIKFDETLLRAAGQPSATYSGPVRQPYPGLGLSQQGIPGSRPIMPPTAMRPRLPNSVSSRSGGALQSSQQRPGVLVMERDLVNQQINEEQSTLNLKPPKPADMEKKVQGFEEILDSKEKIEFYRTKMQELVLYKSRCDNRLNEITERASADRREVELLGKKYEEKYKQVGEIASKLTVEEATFRDSQERKLELQNALIKMEQGVSTDGLLQVRADRIQSDLEELAKALNERCKLHGLHVKQTASIELPFGWQPGIQEGAVDWDEDWDKFEDEGFMVAKDLTIEVENVGAPGNAKSPSTWSDKASADEVSPTASSTYTDKALNTRINQSGSAYAQSEGSARSPPGSPGRSTSESTPQEFHSTHFEKDDFSPRVKGSFSDHGGAESTISGDKYTDDRSWGPTFDANDDVDSVWGFNPMKDTDHERSGHGSFFGSGDFGLNPIKVDSPSGSSVFGKEKRSPFFDSVPSTPAFSSNSPRFNEGMEDHSFDNFSRFDSFNMHDSGFFPQNESLARFDSIRSTRDSDHNRGFSFDDTDPFDSSGPFKASESHSSPRRVSDNWSAF